MMPSKSGVLGLLAAAQGRRRVDPIEDLAGLRFGVRLDQPGRLLRDFQTAIDWSTGDSMPLSTRYYVADAAFVAAVEGDVGLMQALCNAVRRPSFPLYLGRRSCAVTGELFLGLTDRPLEEALRAQPWVASAWYRRKQPASVELDLYVDAAPEHAGLVLETRRDAPESFDPARREYGWRDVVQLPAVVKENPDGYPAKAQAAAQDWFAAVEGA